MYRVKLLITNSYVNLLEGSYFRFRPDGAPGPSDAFWRTQLGDAGTSQGPFVVSGFAKETSDLETI